ncbi:hypothetical protein BHM03_00027516 [Ensete ventricosum]|nr:hypothetical protein BHM03_00027516 [Ensete ventricosum]
MEQNYKIKKPKDQENARIAAGRRLRFETDRSRARLDLVRVAQGREGRRKEGRRREEFGSLSLLVPASLLLFTKLRDDETPRAEWGVGSARRLLNTEEAARDDPLRRAFLHATSSLMWQLESARIETPAINGSGGFRVPFRICT